MQTLKENDAAVINSARVLTTMPAHSGIVLHKLFQFMTSDEDKRSELMNNPLYDVFDKYRRVGLDNMPTDIETNEDVYQEILREAARKKFSPKKH